MENKNIIIILVVVILVLAIVAGVMFTQKMTEKEPSKLKITSNKTLYEGDNLTLQLTDLNKTPLSNQKVNITVKDSKGKTVVNKSVETNSKGKAKVDLGLEKGKYAVNVTYGGNENYTGTNATQKLTIKEEEVVEPTVEYTSSQDSTGETTDSYVYEREKIFAARQKAAEDGIPMYQYSSSPELVEKYQAMV